jgi:hypothetical protein
MIHRYLPLPFVPAFRIAAQVSDHFGAQVRRRKRAELIIPLCSLGHIGQLASFGVEQLADFPIGQLYYSGQELLHISPMLRDL